MPTLPVPSAGGPLDAFRWSRDATSLYRKYFGSDRRRERLLWATIGFTGAFGAARGITHAIRAGRGPFGNISPGGRHIHHMTFGIVGLLVCGYLWAAEIGVGLPHNGRASRLTALLYGAGAALTLDEFALWLNLEDDYWTKEGRKSIDAVVLFACLLMLGLLGRAPLLEIQRTRRQPPLTRARLRRKREVAYHPRTPPAVTALLG